MLRIRRKGTQTNIEYRGIGRQQVASVITNHLRYWSREFVEPSASPLDPRTGDPSNKSAGQAYAATREIPSSDFEAEWQDGNGNWDESKPAEKITIS